MSNSIAVLRKNAREERDETCSALRIVEIGTDEDGAPITSCIVEAAEHAGGTQLSRRKAPTGVAKLGLEKLHECIVDLGRTAPVSDKIPPGVRGVTLGHWRDYLAKAAIINMGASHREQFRRIRVTLETGGFIGIWDDFVWPVT